MYIYMYVYITSLHIQSDCVCWYICINVYKVYVNAYTVCVYYNLRIHTTINDIQYKQSDLTSKSLRVVHTLQRNTERGAQIMWGGGGGGPPPPKEKNLCV